MSVGNHSSRAACIEGKGCVVLMTAGDGRVELLS